MKENDSPKVVILSFSILALVFVVFSTISIIIGVYLSKYFLSFYIGEPLIYSMTGVISFITFGLFKDTGFLGKLVNFIGVNMNLAPLKNSEIDSPLLSNKMLKTTQILFSAKTRKEIFEPLIGDWNEEIYDALKKDRACGLFMINLRNFYSFLMVMWMKSPIGDLIEFISKLAK